MKLAAAVALLLATPTAWAETSLYEYGPSQRAQPASQLFEAACDLEVELRGALAQVTVRQRIVNAGRDELAARYEFDLPRGAAITRFSYKGERGVEQALPIPGAFSSTNLDTRPMVGVDPALLVAQGPDAGAQYLLRVQPIGADREVLLTTQYTAVGEIRGGAIRFVLPGRSHRGKLTACHGTVRASAGPGARIAGLSVAGIVTARPTATFVVDDADVEIDAALEIAGRQPVVWTQSQPLVDGWTATLVTAAAPTLKTITPQARRALFVIDTSRSMELVGRTNVGRLVARIASALPAGTEIEGVVYDRTADRVFGAWKPGGPTTIAELQAAVTKRPPRNGTSLPTAFALANKAITDGARAQTLVVVVSDGVLGETSGSELTRALDLKTSTVDVLAVVLDPGATKSPDAEALRSPVNLYGGSFVELGVSELDSALELVDSWLRPAWLELAMGSLEIPATLHAGGGFTRTVIHRGNPANLVLRGHGDTTIKIAPRPGPAAPIAAVALAALDPDRPAFVDHPAPDDSDLERGATLAKKARAAVPFVREDLAFAVLSAQGKVAASRKEMVRGGGPYERVTLLPDQDPLDTGTRLRAAPLSASAISKITLERLFRDQLQPKAYACYQRALGIDPKLAGTVMFDLRMGRGEVTQATATGLVSPTFEACLLDAAYGLEVPFPDFTKNADDQTIAHYPLTFNISDARPVIILGDADSASPIDIDAVPGGVPVKVRPNAATPLGDLRPGKQP